MSKANRINRENVIPIITTDAVRFAHHILPGYRTLRGLQQQMERITQLPRARQQFVMEVIESVLAQASR